MKKIPIILTLALIFTVVNAFAAITLPDVIGSNMVLQRNENVPIWGFANPNESIEVIFNNQNVSTIADQQGRWKVTLSPMKANATPSIMIITGQEHSVELENILVGEVWLCSGQSNMQWEVQQSKNGEEAIKTADNQNIRLFNVSRDVGLKRKEGKLAIWQECNSESVKQFSGVGYFFGLSLYAELNIPIGLLNSSYGGSQAEAWTPIEYLNAHEDLKPCIEREAIWRAERPRIEKEFQQQLVDWEKAVETAKKKGEVQPRKPRTPDAMRDYRIAASIYNGMIEPLIPFRIRGAIWYQGESNAERAEQYELLLKVMIHSWREQWGQGDFPFAIVQLPNFRSVNTEPTDLAWSHLRDAQRKVYMTTKNTGLVVTTDLGEADDIHPTNKKDVADRLFLWSIADVYGENITKMGPVYVSAKFKHKKAIITFSEVGVGLQSIDGKALQEFAIAGENKDWVWAKAKIRGKNKVVVWSDKVTNPKAVRYAFNNNPVNPNLSNETGIPAVPFRTDDWIGPTHGKR